MKRPPRRFALVVCVVGALVVVVGGLRLLRARRATELGRRVPSAETNPAAAIKAAQQVPVFEPPRGSPPHRPATPAPPGDTGALPGSLQGTDVDGWLGVDDDGHLVVTPGARWFFEYFLSASGEESLEQLRTRIVAEITKRLPAAGARAAIDLLDRYLTYRDQVGALQESGAAADLEQRLTQLHVMRQQIFGDANATALFGEEEQVQAVDLQRRRVLSDQTLSPDERERGLDALEQQLPATVRQARSETMAALRLQQDEQQLRDAGGSAEDVRALREQRVGAAAAERLDALDRERVQWHQRLDDYGQARQSIEDNPALSPDARVQALEALRAERFTPQERLRVEALDQVRHQPSR
jgi:lipase chaperone LimK